MNVAIITAGGVGSRFSSASPKQFIEINNKELLVYTLEKFQNNSTVDYIVVPCLRGFQNHLKYLKKKYNITKLKWICHNGSTQPESIYNAVNLLKSKINEDDIVMIHAGNRPNINDEFITKMFEECVQKGNAISFIKCPEVVVDINNNQVVDRNSIIRIQTPQVFNFGDLINIYSNFSVEKCYNIGTTCDLAMSKGYKINFVEGSILNIKVTYPDDLVLLKYLMSIDNKNEVVK